MVNQLPQISSFILDTTDYPSSQKQSGYVRFFNNTAPRVGYELYFVQNAAFQLIPTVATGANYMGNR